MSTKNYNSCSPQKTKAIGAQTAKEILALPSTKNAIVLALTGDLGGGKTTFLQGFAKAIGIKEKILSPTFVIMKKFSNFYHIDCYRIKNSKDLLSLGIKEIMATPRNIIAIEWSEKTKDILPKNAINIHFEFIDKNKRKITIDF